MNTTKDPSESTASLGQTGKSTGAYRGDAATENDAANDRGTPRLPDIMSVRADTDGDEQIDQIDICDQRSICISRQGTTSVTTYTDPFWQGLTLAAVQDTDGVPGEEIVLLVTNKDGQFQCVCVIHDRSGMILRYQDALWQSAAVKTVLDTDGEPGKEIVLVATDREGLVQCVCVIHDREGSYASFGDPLWNSVVTNWFEDTDAQPGKEIILEVRDRAGDLHCICIVHDRSEKMVPYSDPLWRTGSIALVMDTDGQPGSDIVVTYAADAGGGIAIIHDHRQDVRTYTFKDDFPSIQQTGNFDKFNGSEICVLLATEGHYALITDRLSEQKLTSDCTPSSSTGRV